MPGAGTRTATSSASPPARCLDLTRLISRQGRGPLTGVDRVELAYLRHLLADDVALFLLVRTVLGYVLLDQSGAEQLLSRLDGRVAWGKPDLVGHLSRKMNPEKRAAEADLRRLAVARCRQGALGDMLRAGLPAGTVYLNVGHSNLTDQVFAAWRKVQDARITVLVHDTIPLDYPQYQRPGTPDLFRAKLHRVGLAADLVIYNSAATRTDAERWFASWGRCPDGIVAHLGVDVPDPDPTSLPTDIDLSRPYFVALGTIEPRKNHAFLLDIWEALAEDLTDAEMPRLILAGSRGWANADVFDRLDHSSMIEKHIFERPGYDDKTVAALLAGSAGLLFPSLAEGFGLPPIEAVALNVPVICMDLQVYREFMDIIPVYLKPGDVYSWRQSITRLAREKQAGRERDARKVSHLEIPSWGDHFNFVLKMT